MKEFKGKVAVTTGGASGRRTMRFGTPVVPRVV
jgi:hypothetical protein